MTPIDLLETLARFVTQATKGKVFLRKVDRNSGDSPEIPPKVFIQALPKEHDDLQNAPYILLQYLTGVDNFGGGAFNGGKLESTAQVRIIFVLYENEHRETGALQVLSLITTVKTALLKAGVLENRYAINQTMEHIVYPDPEPPYFFGEIMTNWLMPAIEREVNPYGNFDW